MPAQPVSASPPPAMTTARPVSVAVFAYNESAAIVACLDALAGCAAEAALTVHVLMNGCTDDTEAQVLAYQPRGFTLHPVVIQRGDKANAWNTYVHEIAPAEAVLHVFTDGDMIVAPGSVAGFLEAFAARPEIRGCAGLPISGRSRNAFRDKLLRHHEMAGNLYALGAACIADFRARNLRLPVGMFGEDGLVTMLVKHDLDPQGPQRDERIGATQRGGFAFLPLSPWKPSDWRIYRNRRMRYAVRRQQANMLYPLLRQQGVAAMPAHVIDLYRAHQGSLQRGWSGLDTYFDWVARKRILRDAAASTDAKDEERAHLYS